MSLASGGIAGFMSVLAFTWIHDLFISDIWGMLPIMGVAGVVCGLSLAWSYSAVVQVPSPGSWIAYITAFTVMFCLLAVASVMVFDPVTTMAAVLAAGGPIDHLFGQALPLSIGFAVVFPIVLIRLFGKGWSSLGRVLMTSVLLMALLGMNVSAIGLVDIPVEGWYLVAELLGLVVGLGVIYMIMALALDRITESRSPRSA